MFKLGSSLVSNQRLDLKLHKGFRTKTVRTLRVTAFSPDRLNNLSSALFFWWQVTTHRAVESNSTCFGDEDVSSAIVHNYRLTHGLLNLPYEPYPKLLSWHIYWQFCLLDFAKKYALNHIRFLYQNIGQTLHKTISKWRKIGLDVYLFTFLYQPLSMLHLS